MQTEIFKSIKIHERTEGKIAFEKIVRSCFGISFNLSGFTCRNVGRCLELVAPSGNFGFVFSEPLEGDRKEISEYAQDLVAFKWMRYGSDRFRTSESIIDPKLERAWFNWRRADYHG